MGTLRLAFPGAHPQGLRGGLILKGFNREA
jgi:hypothetical protein